jgi:hypothetical protein
VTGGRQGRFSVLTGCCGRHVRQELCHASGRTLEGRNRTTGVQEVFEIADVHWERLSLEPKHPSFKLNINTSPHNVCLNRVLVTHVSINHPV